jgi:hypothetical protein
MPRRNTESVVKIAHISKYWAGPFRFPPCIDRPMSACPVGTPNSKQGRQLAISALKIAAFSET